ncbi:vicilin Pis v 3.0101-like [Euphorbia lathyris]|uniref:vicilin Pis v 3.0101-like n=1 Tax=Euphorbia lathyris TaxID=212925 RepID=UPI00331334A3
MKLSASVILFSLLVLCATLALAKTDPELKQCRHQCKVQRQYGKEEKDKCLQKCDDYYKEKKGQEDDVEELGVTVNGDPEKKLRECQTQCERQAEGQQKALCRLQCQHKYGKEKSLRGEGEGHSRSTEEEEDEDEERENPYVFEDQHFTSIIRTRHGRIDVLQKFTDKSGLLRGIEHYRVAFLEANPQTFVAPTHVDADSVLFVATGRGTITMIQEDKRESFNIERGNVIRVEAGTPVYLINSDEREKLRIVKFLSPVNLPGEAEAFQSAGGEDQPESFYRAFSWELLEAALKTDRRKLEQIFNQKQGAIVKASKEQIQAMSHREEGTGIWPFSESRSAFNLLKKPVIRNKFGQLFEAKPNEYKQQLQDLDLAVSLANITRGSMAGPFYNSRATKIAIVLDGEGYFEMACPHVSGRRRVVSPSGRGMWDQGPSYKKVSSELSQGTVFIVPAGHPVATVASRNENLVILCFEVNAQGSTRYALAGKNNVVKRIEREAKELAFGVGAKQVEQAFGNEDDELFFPGPRGGGPSQGLFASA